MDNIDCAVFPFSVWCGGHSRDAWPWNWYRKCYALCNHLSFIPSWGNGSPYVCKVYITFCNNKLCYARVTVYFTWKKIRKSIKCLQNKRINSIPPAQEPQNMLSKVEAHTLLRGFGLFPTLVASSRYYIWRTLWDALCTPNPSSDLLQITWVLIYKTVRRIPTKSLRAP